MKCWFCGKDLPVAEGVMQCSGCKMWYAKDKDGIVVGGYFSRTGAEARVKKENENG